MAVKYHQISLKDIFSDCRDMFIDDTPSFFQLLEEHFDLSEFIPSVFYNAFYQHLGRKRDYPLTAFLSALILQKIFSIPTDSLLILLLHICKELRDFCGFSKVPDAPLFTRFKLGFADHIELMFQQMVDYTEPICQTVDASLASMLTFDTSGIELYVTENNPKTLNSLIRRLKTYYKDNPDVDPYKMAYGLMPSQAASCPDANSSISTAISAMLTSSPSSPTAWASCGTSLFWMMILRPPTRKSLWKRSQTPRMRINPSAIPRP